MGRIVLVCVVAVVALAAGVAVAGLPDDVPSDIVSTEIADKPANSVTTTTVRRTVSSATTDGPTTLRESTTTRPRPPTTTSAVATTVPATTAATTSTLAPVAAVHVVVANAGPADLLAARAAAVLRTFGYANVAVATATERRAVSAVLYAPGREGEARVLAGQLGIAETEVAAAPQSQLTVGNAQGDVWLLIGTDRVQGFE